jgi:hypothetical protein
MITINNVSNDLKPNGKYDYELKINGRSLAKFNHIRKKDFVGCLRNAVAVNKAEMDKEKEL